MDTSHYELSKKKIHHTMWQNYTIFNIWEAIKYLQKMNFHHMPPKHGEKKTLYIICQKFKLPESLILSDLEISWFYVSYTRKLPYTEPKTH